MAKELTNKVKEGIVNSQLNSIMEMDFNNLINHHTIKDCLIKGMNEYLSKEEKNKEIDIRLMKELDKKNGSKVLTRLINSAREYFQVEYPNNPNESQVLELYNTAQNNLEKNGKYFTIKNYGCGAHTLLGTYLKEKKLI
jgi:hypothetical protein